MRWRTRHYSVRLDTCKKEDVAPGAQGAPSAPIGRTARRNAASVRHFPHAVTGRAVPSGTTARPTGAAATAPRGTSAATARAGRTRRAKAGQAAIVALGPGPDAVLDGRPGLTAGTGPRARTSAARPPAKAGSVRLRVASPTVVGLAARLTVEKPAIRPGRGHGLRGRVGSARSTGAQPSGNSRRLRAQRNSSPRSRPSARAKSAAPRRGTAPPAGTTPWWGSMAASITRR